MWLSHRDKALNRTCMTGQLTQTPATNTRKTEYNKKPMKRRKPSLNYKMLDCNGFKLVEQKINFGNNK